MILLHRLRTQNFKQLTNLDLAFPERGTVLIEGLNEAGKSSLFEAVFFALYGRTLAREQDYSIRHLKTYNAEEMRVELEFSIAGRPFTISRRVVANQKASLMCPTLDGQTETFTGLRPIEQRLREELRLTPEALLNTCFVEQKGLERLESLQADQRRETVNELLNLRVLSQLDDEYRISRDDHAAVVNQRRRVEIATLDAALPALRAAELTATRCLIYTRILECERHLQGLEEQMAGARTRQTEIGRRRREIGFQLQQAERIRSRLQAIEGDLSLRARAWLQAQGLRAAADAEVQRLEDLEAGLPGRETQLHAWEALGRNLGELERLEALLVRQRAELKAAEEQLARFDALQSEWEAGEDEREGLKAALAAKEAEVARADAALRSRIQDNQRCERLALLLRHLAAYEQAGSEAADLSRQLEGAREAAGRLEEHRLRLRDLEDLEERLRCQDEELRELQRVQRDLAASEREQEALQGRETKVRTLEAELTRLEADRTAAETEERRASVELRKAEARVALGEWAAAAEWCAEADPTTGRLADLQTRQSEAATRLDASRRAAGKASGNVRLAGVVSTVGLLLAAGGIAAQQIATAGVIGLILLLAGLAWVLAAAKQLGTARAEEASARKACDGLEGERRAVERDAHAAGAEQERRRSQEAECRRVLQQLAVEIPATPTDARRTLASLPDTPVTLAREMLETARQRAASCRNELELAQRSLEAERGRPGEDPTALKARLAELTDELNRLQQAVLRAAEIPQELEALGIRDAAGLKGLLNEARSRVSTSRTAAESLPQLELRRVEKVDAAASELEEARKLAVAAGLSGEDGAAWKTAAQHQRAEHQQAIASLPDAALESGLEDARQAATILNQQLTRLETAQEGRRGELDRHPRASLAQVLLSQQEALAATEAALVPLGEVRSTLESAGLPMQSAELRPRLAVLRGELERDQQLVQALPEKRGTRDRYAAEAEARATELATAWQSVLEEDAPAAPEVALERLPQVSEVLRRELSALDEPTLRLEDKALQEENAALDREQATWAHDRDLQRRGEEALLAELGVAPDTVIADLSRRFPELGAAGERDSDGWSVELDRRREAVRANRADRRAKAEMMGLGEVPLDLTPEREALAGLERALAVKRRAGEIVTQTRQSIVNRVMPLTMQNMRQILPLLTEGRYQDAEWDEQNNVISVYDMRAGSFQRKRVFSGGARDQISLSLRLAFALATLPGEHNVRPGWLFLDEPLSSFDHSRTQALVDLLTRGLVRRQFAQIFLISHSQSFDPGRFDYRIRMEGGQIVETSLPLVA